MKIERALDWDKISIDLQRQLARIDYNPDLRKMLKNIDGMVTELSKLEVAIRRSGKYSILDDKVLQINNAINHLEQLIIVAYLVK